MPGYLPVGASSEAIQRVPVSKRVTPSLTVRPRIEVAAWVEKGCLFRSPAQRVPGKRVAVRNADEGFGLKADG